MGDITQPHGLGMFQLTRGRWLQYTIMVSMFFIIEFMKGHIEIVLKYILSSSLCFINTPNS